MIRGIFYLPKLKSSCTLKLGVEMPPPFFLLFLFCMWGLVLNLSRPAGYFSFYLSSVYRAIGSSIINFIVWMLFSYLYYLWYPIMYMPSLFVLNWYNTKYLVLDTKRILEYKFTYPTTLSLLFHAIMLVFLFSR